MKGNPHYPKSDSGDYFYLRNFNLSFVVPIAG